MKSSIGFVLIFAASAAPIHADLVITEFLANPAAVGDADGEYFEVYNSGPQAIAVNTLTIFDDGTNSVDLAAADTDAVIPAQSFFVFGNHAATYVDLVYTDFGAFILANGEDEIAISITSTNTEIARLNYTDGDRFGAGIANVLDNVANATAGVTLEANYLGESLDNDTLPTDDIGSPGVAGSTVIPEPASAALLGLGTLLIARRRR